MVMVEFFLFLICVFMWCRYCVRLMILGLCVVFFSMVVLWVSVVVISVFFVVFIEMIGKLMIVFFSLFVVLVWI